MTLAFILAGPDLPDDIGAPDRYAASPAARHAEEVAGAMAARDRAWAEAIRSDNVLDAHRALTTLMHEYADRLVRFAYGFVGSADAAEDLIQNVFIRVWERRETIRPEDSLRAYLFTAVRRAALNFLKRRTIEARYVSRISEEGGRWEPPDAETQMNADDAVYEVQAAMAQLTERRRTALRLRYEEQLPFAIVAEVMGVSEKAAKHLVTRAVEEVRHLLGL